MKNHKSGNDQAANLAKGEEFCRCARAMGADIALFPEMWNIGYTSFAPDTDGIEDDIWKAPALWSQISTPITSPDFEQARLRWQAQAIKQDAPFVQHFQGSYASEEEDGDFYASAVDIMVFPTPL